MSASHCLLCCSPPFFLPSTAQASRTSFSVDVEVKEKYSHCVAELEEKIEREQIEPTKKEAA